MDDGLYRVEFATPIGRGYGVVSKRASRAEGGDSGYSYIGSFQENGSTISASVQVAQHTPGAQNVFGPLTQFQLNLQGTSNGNSAKLKGTSPAAPALTLDVSMTLIS